jgi:hypothetical protein
MSPLRDSLRFYIIRMKYCPEGQSLFLRYCPFLVCGDIVNHRFLGYTVKKEENKSV